MATSEPFFSYSHLGQSDKWPILTVEWPSPAFPLQIKVSFCLSLSLSLYVSLSLSLRCNAAYRFLSILWRGLLFSFLDFFALFLRMRSSVCAGQTMPLFNFNTHTHSHTHTHTHAYTHISKKIIAMIITNKKMSSRLQVIRHQTSICSTNWSVHQTRIVAKEYETH